MSVRQSFRRSSPQTNHHEINLEVKKKTRKRGKTSPNLQKSVPKKYDSPKIKQATSSPLIAFDVPQFADPVQIIPIDEHLENVGMPTETQQPQFGGGYNIDQTITRSKKVISTNNKKPPKEEFGDTNKFGDTAKAF